MTATKTAVETVQDLFAAFGRGDVPFILQHVTPDCRWVAPGQTIPNAGVFTGPQGAAEFFTRLGASEQITRFEPREFFANAAGDVVVLGHEACRTMTTGREVATDWAMLFRVRDGKVSGYQSYYDTEAYAAAHRQ